MLIGLGEGTTLIRWQARMLDRSGVIDDAVYVVGYLADRIEQETERLNGDLGFKLRTIYNPFYDVSNNLHTLWLARHEMTQDFIICNGDNLFHPRVYSDLCQIREPGIYLTTSRNRHYDEDDMKVALDREGRVKAVSKRISPTIAAAESVGLVLVRGAVYRRAVVESLDHFVRQESHRNAFWLEIFHHLRGASVAIRTFEIDGARLWQEVDFRRDIRAASALLRNWYDEIEP